MIALLRGINVGGHNKLKMADLRDIATRAGFADPVTYLQSGNLVLPTVTNKPCDVEAALASAIAKHTDLTIPVIVRTKRQWTKLVQDNPYAKQAAADGKLVHCIVLPGKATAAVKSFDTAPFAPDEITVGSTHIYLSVPSGMSRTKLYPKLVRVSNADAGTARNWKSVIAIQELLAG